MNTLDCRSCLPGDVEEAVPLMHTSGPKAFDYVFCDRNGGQSDGFLKHAFVRKGSEFGFEQHLCLVLDEKLVAIGGARFADQNFGFTLNALGAISSYYSPLASLRTIGRGLKIEQVLKPPQKGVGIIYNLAVAPGHQSKGYGEQLIGHLLETIRARGMEQAALDVSAENPRAAALYERLGFKTITTYKGGLASRFGEVVDHIYMELEL